MNNFVCIYMAQDVIEANIIKSHLENEGVFCVIDTQDASGVLPQLQFLQGGVKVFVHKDDAAKSLEIINKADKL